MGNLFELYGLIQTLFYDFIADAIFFHSFSNYFFIIIYFVVVEYHVSKFLQGFFYTFSALLRIQVNVWEFGTLSVKVELINATDYQGWYGGYINTSVLEFLFIDINKR